MNPAEEVHRELRELLGAYALQDLGPEAASSVQAHLDGCAACRAELAEIAPLREALRGVDVAALSTTATPPADLGSRIRAAVGSERRQRHRRTSGRRILAAAAAVAAVLAVGSLGVALGERRAVPPLAAPVPFEPVDLSVPGTDISAEAGVVPHTWGVEIELTAVGFEPGESYLVMVETEDGGQRSAGGFVGTGERSMTCNLTSDVLRADAAGFTVLDAAGTPVLSADLPPL